MFIGASVSEPHTSVVYGTTCIDRPTDRPCPSHSCDTDTFARAHATTRHCHTALMWTVQCVVVIATRLRTPTMGKRKAETPAQQTARETSEPLHTCASLSVSPCILGFHVRNFFLPVTSYKFFFTLSYISTTCAHCILDKTSRTRNAYGGAKTPPSHLACRLQHSSGLPPAMIIICPVIM